MTEQVFSIGHSNHPLERFVELLAKHRVAVVADIRSHPGSKYSPHFDREVVKRALSAAGIRYVFLGDTLGGRPSQPDFYDREGHVLYRRVAETQWFRDGIERLLSGARRYRVAMMCSEENPRDCHRRLLVGRVLMGMGVGVIHIRGDGALQSEDELIESEGDGQAALFGDAQEDEWRSTRSVLQRGQQPTSSEH